MSRHKHASQIIYVNDTDDIPYTTKDTKRKLRCVNPEAAKNIFIKAMDKFPSTKAFQDFLHYSANK